jgi:SpoIID/LytB domain protein
MDKLEEPTISVGIMAAERTVQILLTGPFRMDRHVKVPAGQYTVRAGERGIRLSHIKKDIAIERPFLELVPEFPQRSYTVLHKLPVGTGFHWQHHEDRKFEGHVLIRPVGEQTVEVINKLPIETYLSSVVASEMNENAPLEFLRAHAVISRSWAMTKIRARGLPPCPPDTLPMEQENHDRILRWTGAEIHEGFDVCASDHCQRYRGVPKEGASNSTRAVEDTQGEVLMYGGHICDTRYAKCCGGMTENFRTAWEDRDIPYLRALADNDHGPLPFDLPLSDEANARAWIMGSPTAYCNVRNRELLESILPTMDSQTVDFFRWQTLYSQEEIRAIIVQKTGRSLGHILDLVPLERGGSGRIIQLHIVGTEGTLTVGKELEIRRVLSRTHLYSSAFLVSKEPGRGNTPGAFRFVGAGWGHGVGLCQIGAAMMAVRGKTYRDILDHYFPGTSLRPRYGRE